MTTVCFDKTFFVIILVIAVFVILYNHYSLTQENKNLRASLQLSTDNNKLQTQPFQQIQQTHPSHPSQPFQPTQPFQQTQPFPPIPPIGQMVKDYDHRQLNDPLSPPLKRDDSAIIPSQIMRPDLFNVPTRNGPGIYHKMGYIKTNDPAADYKILTLVGRPRWVSSTQYQYYVTTTKKDDTIKFFLDNYRRELYDGDIVKINQLDDIEYIVYIDKDLDLEYNPGLF